MQQMLKYHKQTKINTEVCGVLMKNDDRIRIMMLAAVMMMATKKMITIRRLLQ